MLRTDAKGLEAIFSLHPTRTFNLTECTQKVYDYCRKKHEKIVIHFSGDLVRHLGD